MADYTKRDLAKLETRRLFADMQAHPYVPPAKPVCVRCGADPAWEVNTPRTRGSLYFCDVHRGEAEAIFARG